MYNEFITLLGHNLFGEMKSLQGKREEDSRGQGQGERERE